STQNGTSSKTALKFSATVGAKGGGGGDSDGAHLSVLPGTLIETAGDTAYAIRVGSVGGGGGDSTGGSYQLGLPSLDVINKFGQLFDPDGVPSIAQLPPA